MFEVQPVGADPSLEGPLLAAPYAFAYTYRRSLGEVLGSFFGALAAGRFLGVRAMDGRVLVPPREYDPITAEPLDALVSVGSAGVVTTWSWVTSPLPTHPLEHPFAWALIRLDGADTPLLHAVDAGEMDRMATGMRVQARWRDTRGAGIADVACFEPEPTAPCPSVPEDAAAAVEALRRLKIPVRLDYRIQVGRDYSRFLRGLAQRRFIGQRCPTTGHVYVPSRGSNPTTGEATGEVVEVSDTGTITTFCVTNIPFEGQDIETPYVAASVLLDGADIAIFALVQGLPAHEVRMGLRVRAVWAADEALTPSWSSVLHFAPTGEADAPFESYGGYL